MKKTLTILLAALLAFGLALATSAEEPAAQLQDLVQEETLQSERVVDLDTLLGTQQAASALPTSTHFMCIEGIQCEEDFECGANGCCLGRECHCD
ncbi:MAG: hypothetical protein AAF481_11410 [Acidobacteriota bacterium]